jgi:hypothetical protein
MKEVCCTDCYIDVICIHKQQQEQSHTARMRALLLPSTAYTPLSASALACTWHRYSASTRRGSASSTARLQAAATAPITWQQQQQHNSIGRKHQQQQQVRVFDTSK